MYNNNMLYIPIVVSSTGKSLWENSFDDVFIKRLYSEIPNSSIKRMEDVSRHDARLIDVFKSVYGSECMGCEFARFEYIKYYYAESYRIKRMECYKGIYFPEYVEIDKNHYIRSRNIKEESELITIKNDTVYKDIGLMSPVKGYRYPYAPMHPYSSLLNYSESSFSKSL
jgi:hypothetical protein